MASENLNCYIFLIVWHGQMFHAEHYSLTCTWQVSEVAYDEEFFQPKKGIWIWHRYFVSKNQLY